MTKQEKIAYLRDLAARLMRVPVPVKYGTDQFDVETLLALAKELEDES